MTGHSTRHIRRVLIHPAFWLGAVILLYLVLSRDGYHHWDDECYLAEAAYGRESGFRCLWVDHFRLHVGLVAGLVKAVGTGPLAVELTGAAYALLVALTALVLMAAAAEAGWVGDLRFRRAAFVALFLFLPTSLYLGYKTLSEVPALLFGALSVWLFLRALRASGVPAVGFSALSALAAVLSSAARLDGILILGGFVVALLLFPGGRARRNVLLRGGVALGVIFILYGGLLFGLGYNPFERYIPSAFISQVLPFDNRYVEPDIDRVLARPGPGIRFGRHGSVVLDALGFLSQKSRSVVRILLGFGVAALLMLLALRSRHPAARTMWAWLVLLALPSVLLLAHFYEVRYAYPTLLPAAVLAYLGWERLRERVPKRAAVGGLAAVCLLNLAVVPYLEVATDADSLLKAYAFASVNYARPVILVPAARYSDYAFVRFARPDLEAYPAQSFNQFNRSIVPVMEYVWGGRYVGNAGALRSRQGDFLLICVDGPLYRTALKEMVRPLTPNDSFRRLSQCEQTWLWSDPAVTRAPVAAFGAYQVFEIGVV